MLLWPYHVVISANTQGNMSNDGLLNHPLILVVAHSETPYHFFASVQLACASYDHDDHFVMTPLPGYVIIPSMRFPSCSSLPMVPTHLPKPYRYQVSWHSSSVV